MVMGPMAIKDCMANIDEKSKKIYRHIIMAQYCLNVIKKEVINPEKVDEFLEFEKQFKDERGIEI